MVFCCNCIILREKKNIKFDGTLLQKKAFKPLLEGKDPLTNMHANTTI